MTVEQASYIEHEPVRFNGSEIEDMLGHAVKLGASDITIQTSESIICSVNGCLVSITRKLLSNAEVSSLLNYMYGANATTILMSGKDLDTYYEFRPSRMVRHRFRLNATACLVEGYDGIQITLRSIPTDPPDLDDMDLQDELRESLVPNDGVIYVTGSTGSGKSTLMASIVKYIASMEDCNRKIITYESPIEFVYDSVKKSSCVVSQSEIPRHLPSFSDGVRNALRRTPRLILVGESRDLETIDAVLEAALTGHPVYTTVHSNGVGETMRRLVSTFPSSERASKIIDIIETTRLIVWQKLVPTLDGGRVPLREFLIFDEEVKDLLFQGGVDHVIDVARRLVREKGLEMSQDAKDKFDKGIISERTYKLVCAGYESVGKSKKTKNKEGKS